MRKFWESKKVLAFIVCLVVGAVTMIAKTKYGLEIDPNLILGTIGLSGLYVILQGRIDAKKADANKAKAFLESHKFVMVAIGNVIPLLVGIINSKFDTGLTPDMIWGLLGIDTVYLLGKTAIDMKQPDVH